MRFAVAIAGSFGNSVAFTLASAFDNPSAIVDFGSIVEAGSLAHACASGVHVGVGGVIPSIGVIVAWLIITTRNE